MTNISKIMTLKYSFQNFLAKIFLKCWKFRSNFISVPGI